MYGDRKSLNKSARPSSLKSKDDQDKASIIQGTIISHTGDTQEEPKTSSYCFYPKSKIKKRAGSRVPGPHVLAVVKAFERRGVLSNNSILSSSDAKALETGEQKKKISLRSSSPTREWQSQKGIKTYCQTPSSNTIDEPKALQLWTEPNDTLDDLVEMVRFSLVKKTLQGQSGEGSEVLKATPQAVEMDSSQELGTATPVLPSTASNQTPIGNLDKEPLPLKGNAEVAYSKSSDNSREINSFNASPLPTPKNSEEKAFLDTNSRKDIEINSQMQFKNSKKDVDKSVVRQAEKEADKKAPSERTEDKMCVSSDFTSKKKETELEKIANEGNRKGQAEKESLEKEKSDNLDQVKKEAMSLKSGLSQEASEDKRSEENAEIKADERSLVGPVDHSSSQIDKLPSKIGCDEENIKTAEGFPMNQRRISGKISGGKAMSGSGVLQEEKQNIVSEKKDRKSFRGSEASWKQKIDAILSKQEISRREKSIIRLCDTVVHIYSKEERKMPKPASAVVSISGNAFNAVKTSKSIMSSTTSGPELKPPQLKNKTKVASRSRKNKKTADTSIGDKSPKNNVGLKLFIRI